MVLCLWLCCFVNDSITQVYSVSALIAYVLGGFLIGHIADHCFVRKLKSLLLIVTAVDTMTFLACTVRGDSSDLYCLLLLVLIRPREEKEEGKRHLLPTAPRVTLLCLYYCPDRPDSCIICECGAPPFIKQRNSVNSAMLSTRNH